MQCPTVLAGIDVSAKSLDVAIQVEGTDLEIRKFGNRASDHKRLVRELRQLGTEVRVVLESTGTYSLSVAMALEAATGIEVMVANPRAVSSFAKATMRRSKSDATDAVVLRQFAECMAFVPWKAPSLETLELRAIGRRIAALTKEKTREKNRLHASDSSGVNSNLIAQDIKVNIRHLDRRIDQLVKQGVAFVEQDPDLSKTFALITSVKGVAAKSAIQIIPELMILPQDMTVREVVAHCGLDPREHESGTSVRKRPRISRLGNVNLRRALFMPALVAIQREPRVKAFRDKLVARGKTKLQAVVAVMRKLLHAFYGMLRSGLPFDGEKFYKSA